MLKPLFLAAVLLAQLTPPPMGPRAPMIPAPPGAADGITVMGNGYANAPAAQAQVTLRISTRNNALSLNAQTLQPIADALVKAGAEPSSIILPPYLVGQAHTNNASITATVQHPTQQMLQQGMLTVANAFASAPDLILNFAEVRLTADNCAALQRSAEANAIANARTNAAFLAKQIGARTGDVLALDERSTPIGSPGACTSMFTIGSFGPAYPQTSPSDLLTVKVYAGVTMRFAIRR